MGPSSQVLLTLFKDMHFSYSTARSPKKITYFIQCSAEEGAGGEATQSLLKSVLLSDLPGIPKERLTMCDFALCPNQGQIQVL